MIKEFYVSKSGDFKLSDNFKVREFACKDGSDKVLIDTNLVDKLQQLRNYLGKPLTIVSGFRSESYNESCGGAKGSYHVRGMATDIYCNGVKPIVLALWAEMNGLGGVGIYTNRTNEFVHIDTRETKYRWINRNGTNETIKSMTDLL